MTAVLTPDKLDTRALDERARRIGHDFFDQIEGSSPKPYQVDWWEQRLLNAFTQDEWLKVQAFRFVDVLPTMAGNDDIARHLREYFVHPDHEPGAANQTAHGHNGHDPHGLSELQRSSGKALAALVSGVFGFRSDRSLWARTLASIAWSASQKMAHKFIAGTNIAEAAAAIEAMRRKGLAFSIDVLGEAAVSDRESDEYQRIYLELIEGLSKRAKSWTLIEGIDRAAGQPIPPVNVSVKLTSLFSQFDAIDPDGTKRGVKERLRPLLRAGMDRGAHVHIDMEHYWIKDVTLEICEEIFLEPEFRDYPHFGLVLQAYLLDGDADARRIVDYARRRGTPLWVRLVKGAYWDTETVLHEQFGWPIPVWQQKWQSDACYERMSRTLLENWRHVHGAFGSHNIRSLAHAMALQELLEIPPTAFELQMLFGMGDPLKRAAVRMGQRCRIYTPYGELLPGMAYLIRRLLENTANESFLRHTVDANTPRDQLLEDPEQTGLATPPPAPQPRPIRYDFGVPIMHGFENVPNSDFSREDVRLARTVAQKAIAARLGREYPLVINGERIMTDERITSRDPSQPDRVVGHIAMATTAHADQAVAAAKDAFATWRHVPVRARAQYLFTVAKLMEQSRHELASWQTYECGKPWRESDADVSEAIDFCNFYGLEMIRFAENPRRRDVPGETNEYGYAPRGVVGVIAPWNFPLAILTGMATAAIVAGNTVIIKPAEQSSVVAYGLIELFERAQLPQGVLHYLPGDGAVVGAHLVEHPDVSMIVFTGSRAVGCEIYRRAAGIHTAQPGLKKVVAEMGGKNATIIDSDADLDEAVKNTVYSAFGYAGQKCSAGSRIIVLDAVYDRFVERFVEAARSVQVTPAADPGTFVPPVIDEEAFHKISEYIEIGRSEAHPAYIRDNTDLRNQTSGGYFVGPAVFTDVAPNARIAQEEIFGPVTAIIRARDITHAIEIFNGTDYGLTGGIFSRSPANIDRCRAECDCGNFYINRKITAAQVDRQPFGGFKMSGVGSKAGGPDYLQQFCEPRNITENTLRRGFAPSEEVADVLD